MTNYMNIRYKKAPLIGCYDKIFCRYSQDIIIKQNFFKTIVFVIFLFFSAVSTADNLVGSF
jgi:hypothetical protein